MAGGIYYGWYVVAACNGVAFMTWGIGIFNQGVFLGYYVDTHGWDRASLSLAGTLFHVWAGFAGVIIGRVIDRHGPRWVLITGVLALGGGALALGAVHELWHIYPAFLLLGTGFACLHTVTLGKIVARWFRRLRGRAMALATFGASLGGAILVPLNAYLLDSFGGGAAGLALALIASLVVIPLAIWVVKDGPEVLGLGIDGDKEDMAHPDTVDAEAMAAQSAVDQAKLDHDLREWSVPEAMRTTAFWALSIAFFSGMLAQSSYLLHQVMFLQGTFGLLRAASVVTVTTVCGIIGRLLYAAIGDRMRSRDMASMVFLLQAISFLAYVVDPNPWSLIAGSALFGLTMGIIVILQPITTAECFGQQSFGRVFGPIYMSIRIGSAIGPLAIGLIVAATGAYDLAWIMVAAILGFAAIAVRWALPPAPATTPHTA